MLQPSSIGPGSPPPLPPEAVLEEGEPGHQSCHPGQESVRCESGVVPEPVQQHSRPHLHRSIPVSAGISAGACAGKAVIMLDHGHSLYGLSRRFWPAQPGSSTGLEHTSSHTSEVRALLAGPPNMCCYADCRPAACTACQSDPVQMCAALQCSACQSLRSPPCSYADRAGGPDLGDHAHNHQRVLEHHGSHGQSEGAPLHGVLHKRPQHPLPQSLQDPLTCQGSIWPGVSSSAFTVPHRRGTEDRVT